MAVCGYIGFLGIIFLIIVSSDISSSVLVRSVVVVVVVGGRGAGAFLGSFLRLSNQAWA